MDKQPKRRPNERSGVDAGTPLCLHMLRCGPGDTHRNPLGIVKPLTTILTVASAILCGLLAIILIASYCLGDRRHAIALSSSRSIGILDGNLSFGSQSHLFDGKTPTRSVLSYEGGQAKGKVDRNWTLGTYGLRQRTFTGEQGEFVARQRGLMLPGIFYHYLKWENEPVLSTVMVSLWYPVLLLAVFPALWTFRRGRSRSGKSRIQCPTFRWSEWLARHGAANPGATARPAIAHLAVGPLNAQA